MVQAINKIVYAGQRKLNKRELHFLIKGFLNIISMNLCLFSNLHNFVLTLKHMKIFNPFPPSVPIWQRLAKLSILILKVTIKKISYERCDYESVDEKSLS